MSDVDLVQRIKIARARFIAVEQHDVDAIGACRLFDEVGFPRLPLRPIDIVLVTNVELHNALNVGRIAIGVNSDTGPETSHCRL